MRFPLFDLSYPTKYTKTPRNDQWPETHLLRGSQAPKTPWGTGCKQWGVCHDVSYWACCICSRWGLPPAPHPPCGLRGCLQTVAGAPGGLSGTTWGNLIVALGQRRSEPGQCSRLFRACEMDGHCCRAWPFGIYTPTLIHSIITYMLYVR